VLTRQDSLAATRAAFRCEIPARYNMGVDVCDRIAAARPDAPAILEGDRVTSFGALRALSNQIANLLSAHVGQGDRVAVLLPQRLETAASHIAILKMGAIALPLFTLFGPDALLHRLRDSGACAVITDEDGAAKLAQLRAKLPDLRRVYSVDGASRDADCFHSAVAAASAEFEPVDTAADDPALLIYTSGTTGNPKGALHAHRVLLGHLPGVEMSHDFFPQPGDCIWTPADWAWIGGLLDVLMPALHHGVPVVAHRFAKFDGRAAFALMARHKVRNAFLPPTALKLMRQVEDPPAVALRSVASGGETLGAELIRWGQAVFGTTINEFYGQTECNMIVSSCAALEPAKPGVMGFPVPGHEVRVLAASGATGPIAVRAPDPVMFLGYWQNPEATAEKFVHHEGADWLLTGDTGLQEPCGRIRFVGRDDDVISSGRYRIGPAEIEDCLLSHPSVQLAGVVGKPDATRGEIVVAFVQPAAGAVPDAALAEALKAHVKSRLAAYEYPREIHFIEAMPMTTTGKIIRGALRQML
jgi:acetyl-CoA synthetase